MFTYLSENVARVSDCNNIIRYILCNYTSGTYYNIFTDANSGDNDNIGGNPCVFTNMYIFIDCIEALSPAISN